MTLAVNWQVGILTLLRRTYVSFVQLCVWTRIRESMWVWGGGT